ncbi:MAG: hypothetical protein EBR82_76370 [Caulobacteraceae bacterium]|jgi:hypothetical protein|nr:hypothetical protein [Caulobacteraceae bacterium]
MHSKRKGNIGQFGVGLALTKLGYSVFTEEGDISKIDIIAEKDGNLIKIQSKAITPTDGCIKLPLKKSGPNYQFYYDPNMFDYFAVYDLEDGKVYLVSSEILKQNNTLFNLRKTLAKNNQKDKINLACDYEIEKILGS